MNTDKNPYAAPQTRKTPSVDSRYERIGRLEYIYKIGVIFILFLSVLLISSVLLFIFSINENIIYTVVLISFLFAIINFFIISIERAHDMNIKTWVGLLFIIPPIFLAFIVVPGTKYSNQYGSQSIINEGMELIKICFIIIGIILISNLLFFGISIFGVGGIGG